MITLDEFLKRFCEELEDVELNSIDKSTDFKNIEAWDSLVALSVIAMIDEEFDIRVTGSDLIKSTTIEDLYNLIQSKLQ
jgi:acyl carrier protein